MSIKCLRTVWRQIAKIILTLGILSSVFGIFRYCKYRRRYQSRMLNSCHSWRYLIMPLVSARWWSIETALFPGYYHWFRICNYETACDWTVLAWLLQSPAIVIAKTVIFWSCYCWYFFCFFPSTNFSTSLGRFSRNFATRHGMSWNQGDHSSWKVMENHGI